MRPYTVCAKETSFENYIPSKLRQGKEKRERWTRVDLRDCVARLLLWKRMHHRRLTSFPTWRLLVFPPLLLDGWENIGLRLLLRSGEGKSTTSTYSAPFHFRKECAQYVVSLSWKQKNRRNFYNTKCIFGVLFAVHGEKRNTKFDSTLFFVVLKKQRFFLFDVYSVVICVL